MAALSLRLMFVIMPHISRKQAVEKRRRGSQCNTDGGPAKTGEKRSESRSTLRVVNEHFEPVFNAAMAT
jgi:hypothetical protein